MSSEKENKTLNKPFRLPSGSSKKFGVYVKNDKGNVVKVTFGDPNMEIKRDDPDRRKNFRSRHNCDSPGPKWKARYWSCYQWRKGSKVKGSAFEESLVDEKKLLQVWPELQNCEVVCDCDNCDCNATASKEKKGLWYNIRKKKKREGDDYRPARPGEKDRPDPKAFKKAQSYRDEVYLELYKRIRSSDLNPFRGPQKPTNNKTKKKKKESC